MRGVIRIYIFYITVDPDTKPTENNRLFALSHLCYTLKV